MMETKLVVEALKREAETNPASKAALVSFCFRERPRTTLTLVGLEHRMKAEGFDYAKSDFISLVTALANVGFGQLTKDSKGNVTGLKGITTTFKSLGHAVCDKGEELETFKLRNRFSKMPVARRPITQVVSKPSVLADAPTGLTVNLEVSINGKRVHIPIPKDLTNEDILTLVSRFKVS